MSGLGSDEGCLKSEKNTDDHTKMVVELALSFTLGMHCMDSTKLREQFVKLPRHIAIIMDGNGRWAQSRDLPRVEGHRKGVDNVELVVRLAGEIDLEVLTLYAFSSENWKRPQDEVNALMSMLEQFLISKEALLHEQKIALRPIGRISELPETVKIHLNRVANATASYPRTLALALNYGSRLEVLDAVRSYLAAVDAGSEQLSELTWDHFSRHLYTAGLPDPDLIIRTSGETRLSNFLLLQGAYSEIHYSPVNWPEFGREAMISALRDFETRERRFGLTGEQLRDGIDQASGKGRTAS
jgi:undecaprenyl diphosphate synthase